MCTCLLEIKRRLAELLEGEGGSGSDTKDTEDKEDKEHTEDLDALNEFLPDGGPPHLRFETAEEEAAARKAQCPYRTNYPQLCDEDFEAIVAYFSEHYGQGPKVTSEGGRITGLQFRSDIGGMGDHLSLWRMKLPSSIGSCTQLRELSLRRVTIRGRLPRELQNCSNLTRLVLANNAITEFPAWLDKLVRLKELRLLNNYVHMLGNVPEGLDALELERLNLSRAQIKGRFGPMRLFDRLCRAEGSEIVVAGNSFDAVDFGDERFTEGTLRACHEGSMCIASFCGAEFLEWQKLLYRAEYLKDWSQLCVFLKEYATAQVTDKCDESWHAGGCAGSPECKELGRYFDMTGEVGTLTHAKFGCRWFEKWTGNVLSAAKSGHSHLILVTKADFGVGTCQKVEWRFLKELLRKHPGIQVHRCNIMDLEEALAKGVSSYGKRHYPEWDDDNQYAGVDSPLRFFFKASPFTTDKDVSENEWP